MLNVADFCWPYLRCHVFDPSLCNYRNFFFGTQSYAYVLLFLSRAQLPKMTGNDTAVPGTTPPRGASTIAHAVQFAKQAEKLSHKHPEQGHSEVAAEAKFVTPQDPVIVTSDGHRLPGVPLEEAHKLNVLRDELDKDQSAGPRAQEDGETGNHNTGEPHKITVPPLQNGKALQRPEEGTLRKAMPPSHTNPLFPPLPLYGPPSILRDLHCATFRVSSFFLSLSFLGVIVLGSLFTSIPMFVKRTWLRMTFRNPDKDRPFYEEELRRAAARKVMQRNWKRRPSQGRVPVDNETPANNDGYVPTEGGPDPIKCDAGYYARRVGLDVEEFEVQTEDGFIIELWHVYDPREYQGPVNPGDRSARGPDLFTGEKRQGRRLKDPAAPRKYPVLLIHGLLQSAGAYCVNDEQSLAFWLCKSGFDVWLGINRCGFKPKHVLLDYNDPRMWCWNIRQMGVFDLPALTSRVLYETGFSKCGLIAHSQGTTETFVALAKEQRPELGEKLSVFCALAPAAYAGPLIGKMYFKFMRVITPAMFRLMFGIHAFIPIMMTMHELLPPGLYGWLGYKVFSFLFDWSDSRWDRGLRDRMFQFAPVYVSAESMRWWLGRECFAQHVSPKTSFFLFFFVVCFGKSLSDANLTRNASSPQRKSGAPKSARTPTRHTLPQSLPLPLRKPHNVVVDLSPALTATAPTQLTENTPRALGHGTTPNPLPLRSGSVAAMPLWTGTSSCAGSRGAASRRPG